jgi:hypothetical protein
VICRILAISRGSNVSMTLVAPSSRVPTAYCQRSLSAGVDGS